MNWRLPVHNSTNRIAVTLATLVLLLGASCSAQDSWLSAFFEKVGQRGGSESVWPLALFGCGLVACWLYLLLSGQKLLAFCIQILALNFTRRAIDFFYIVSWTEPDGYQEKVSLTTLMLFLFAGLAYVTAKGPAFQRGYTKTGMRILIAMNIWVTATLFLHHEVWNAFWLSVTAVWQYSALFYIVCITVRTFRDARRVVWCLVLTILVGIAIRSLVFGQTFFVRDIGGAASPGGDDFARVLSVAFGNSYGGTVLVILFPALYLLRSASRFATKAIAASIAVVLALEIISTLTRGAWLGLGFVGLLVFWKRQRRLLFYVLIFSILAVIMFWPIIEVVATQRLTFTEEDLLDMSMLSRLYLWRDGALHLIQHPTALIAGYGIAKEPMIPAVLQPGVSLTPHNVVLTMVFGAGVPAPFLLFALLGYTCVGLLRLSRNRVLVAESDLATYLLLALGAWMWFANTTSFAIFYYEAYEALILFYVIVFTALRLLDISAHVVPPLKARPAISLEERSATVGRSLTGSCL